MQCQSCHAEVPEHTAVCPECKARVAYNVEGYPAAKVIQKALKALVDEQYERIRDKDQLIGMLHDYLPEYDEERSLLIRMVDCGVLDVLMGEGNNNTRFNNAREKMTREIKTGAAKAEFVLSAFGYMLSAGYPSPMMIYERPKKVEPVKKKISVLNFEEKVFAKMDAMRFRISRKAIVKEGTTKIEGYCFEGFGMMREVSLPDSLLMVGEYAFTDCKHLEEVVIPDSVKKVEKGVFNACVGLKKAKFPEGLMEIGDNSFFCCTSLKGFKVPESVSSIGQNAFSGCGELERLVIAQNVKFVDANAFAYCPKLTIYCVENSYIHKYCLQNKIKFVTSPAGTPLPSEYEGEEESE